MKPIAFNENYIAHSDSPMLEPEQAELQPVRSSIRREIRDAAFDRRIERKYPNITTGQSISTKPGVE